MCLFSILCSAKTTKQQQQQQQSAATMPSKPAVTGKCQCFNNPTPLTSVAVECVSSLVYAAQCTCVRRSHTEHTASSFYAHPKKEGGRFRKGARCTSHSTHNPADSLVPFHPTLTPEHRTTSAATHRTASPPRWTVWKLSSSTSNCV